MGLPTIPFQNTDMLQIWEQLETLTNGGTSGMLATEATLIDVKNNTQTCYEYLLKENPLYNFLPQLIDGNSDIYFSETAATSDKTLYTVTNENYFYLTDLSAGFTFSVAGVIYLRDGVAGPIMDVFVSSVTTANILRSYKKAKRFSTSVYLDVVSGTITVGHVAGSGIERTT